MRRETIYSPSERSQPAAPRSPDDRRTPAPNPADPPSPPDRRSPLRSRLTFLSRHQRPLLVAAVGLVALLLFWLPTALTPSPRQFTQRDIDAAVSEYLWEAARAGMREVRIIHGKGIGVQRQRVAALLTRHPAVESFGPAPAERGHWGATLVRLRPAART